MFCDTNLKRMGGHIRENQTETDKNSFLVKQILIGKNRTIKRNARRRMLLDLEKLKGVAIKINEKIYELKIKKVY